MYLCMCVYVCMYLCMCMYVCMYVCMHSCMQACTYVRMHACVYVCMYVCVRWYKGVLSISILVPWSVVKKRIWYIKNKLCTTHSHNTSFEKFWSADQILYIYTYGLKLIFVPLGGRINWKWPYKECFHTNMRAFQWQTDISVTCGYCGTAGM